MITNPISLGESIDAKEFLLDIEVTVNKQMKLNLEMQIVNYGNWKERSLSYKMENVKNHRIYTDKMWLSVVELNNTELATEEDRRHQIDQWAKLFKAKTWEELKSIAMTNQYMQSAVNTMYELSVDESIQEQCRRRAEYEYYQKLQAAEIAKLKEELTDLRQANADKDAEIAELKRRLAKTNGDR